MAALPVLGAWGLEALLENSARTVLETTALPGFLVKQRWFGAKARGVAQVFGLSTQTSAYQREAAERLRLPFPLLADPHRAFAMAARLPVFEAGGHVLLRRLTLVIDDGVVSQLFYPVFPPDRSARQVLDWLDAAGA